MTLIDALKGLLESDYARRAHGAYWKTQLEGIIAEHERSGGWLPIDSCPDDGETEVLLGSVEISFPDIGTFDGVGFYKQNGMEFIARPTHWQPMPKGPKS